MQEIPTHPEANEGARRDRAEKISWLIIPICYAVYIEKPIGFVNSTLKFPMGKTGVDVASKIPHRSPATSHKS
jgi:hypothetical protein